MKKYYMINLIDYNLKIGNTYNDIVKIIACSFEVATIKEQIDSLRAIKTDGDLVTIARLLCLVKAKSYRRGLEDDRKQVRSQTEKRDIEHISFCVKQKRDDFANMHGMYTTIVVPNCKNKRVMSEQHKNCRKILNQIIGIANERIASL